MSCAIQQYWLTGVSVQCVLSLSVWLILMEHQNTFCCIFLKHKNYSRSQVTSCRNLWIMSVKVNKYLCDFSVITTQIIVLQIRTITNRTELTQYLFLSCQKFWLVSGTCHKLVRWGQSACVKAVWLINHSVIYCIYKATP